MHFHSPSPPPPSPPVSPTTLPLQPPIKKVEEELNVSSAYTQRQTLQEWLFASIPTHRSPHTLPPLHLSTLIHGLTALRQRITSLVHLDLNLYHKYASLLSNEEVSAKAFAYTGWTWYPPSDSTLELLNREELERLMWLMWQDVAVYDEVVKSVSMWKREVDERIGRVRGGDGRRPWEI